MLDAATLSGLLSASGSEAIDMLSGDIVVGGVELINAEFDEDDMSSDGVALEKLDPRTSESNSAIVGAASMAASMAAIAVDVTGVVVDARRIWLRLVHGGQQKARECEQTRERVLHFPVSAKRRDLSEPEQAARADTGAGCRCNLNRNVCERLDRTGGYTTCQKREEKEFNHPARRAKAGQTASDVRIARHTSEMKAMCGAWNGCKMQCL
jgi:hypothetical protein